MFKLYLTYLYIYIYIYIYILYKGEWTTYVDLNPLLTHIYIYIYIFIFLLTAYLLSLPASTSTCYLRAEIDRLQIW